MAHTTFTNAAIDTAIEHLHDALYAVGATPAASAIDLGDVNAAATELSLLLPAEAADAQRFAHDEGADSSDYEVLYEGLSLVAMYTLIDVTHLREARNLGDLFHTLRTAHDDVSDLTSYASNYDWEHGVFRHGDDEN